MTEPVDKCGDITAAPTLDTSTHTSQPKPTQRSTTTTATVKPSSSTTDKHNGDVEHTTNVHYLTTSK